MRLYIIRHADPDYENNTITPTGHQEAKALAGRLVREKIDLVFSSPMGRARDTMFYTARRLNKPFKILDWTQELGYLRVELGMPYGNCTGWDVHGEIIRGKRLPTHTNWFQQFPFTGVEFLKTFKKVGRDSDEFIKKFGYLREKGRYRIVRKNRKKIAVFCHGGFGLTWLSHLLEIPLPLMWAGFFLPPSSVTTILFDERTFRWAVPRCIGLGDVSHLYAAGLSVQPRGIKANFE